MGNGITCTVAVILAVLMMVLTFVEIGYIKPVDTSNLSTKTDVTNAISSIPKPTAAVVSVDVGNLTAKVDALTADVNKRDNFKKSVGEMALNELERNSDRVLFNWLNNHGQNIDRKTDIISVTVIDQTVSKIDIDNGNAKVVQDLKVKFEDKDVDLNVKVYITVTTVIKDNDIDSQIISYTP